MLDTSIYHYTQVIYGITLRPLPINIVLGLAFPVHTLSILKKLKLNSTAFPRIEPKTFPCHSSSAEQFSVGKIVLGNSFDQQNSGPRLKKPRVKRNQISPSREKILKTKSLACTYIQQHSNNTNETTNDSKTSKSNIEATTSTIIVDCQEEQSMFGLCHLHGPIIITITLIAQSPITTS